MSDGKSPGVLDTALAAASLSQALMEVDEHPYLVLPTGWSVHDLGLYKLVPNRQSGTINLMDLDSFVRFLETHHTRESAIYYHDELLTCVIDECRPGYPSHRAFRATLPARYTEQWKGWARVHNTAMAHLQLAKFFEERVEDFLSPTGAEMMELVMDLETKKSVSFRSAIRLDTGASSFEYEEEIRGQSKVGKMEVPSRFRIEIPLLEDLETRYEIDVRLRFDLTGKTLQFTCLMKNPDRIERAAIEAWRTGVVEPRTGLPCYWGSPG